MTRYAFDFAISFAGENRPTAKRLATLLKKRGAAVFYDRKFMSELHGKSLDDEFRRIYGRASRYVVVLVSKYYPTKEYTNYEFSIAKREAKERKGEFILPLRLDDTLVLGLPPPIAYLDLRKLTLKETARSLLKKLRKSRQKRISGIKRKVVRMKKRAIVRPRIIKLAATFGVNISEMDTSVIPDNIQRTYYAISDWLVDELKSKLWSAGIDFDFLGDERDGEGLSARVVFDWDARNKELDFGDTSPWELLELLPYSELGQG